eukprot:7682723-Alexandrium_andersonii.AAC.1
MVCKPVCSVAPPCQLHNGDPVTTPLVKADGSPNIQAHPLNQRHQEQVLRQYVSSIKQYGNIPGVRGSPWLVAPEKDDGPFLAITYGTLSKAIFIAKQEDPSNPLVEESLRRGLK